MTTEDVSVWWSQTI